MNKSIGQNVLKQRIISAAVLIPLIVLSILFLPNRFFSLLTAVFVGVAALEWSKIIAFRQKYQKYFYVFFAVIILCVSYFYRERFATCIILAGTLWWICAMFMIVAYQKESLSLPADKLFKSIIGILILVPAWMSLVILHANINGPNLVLYLFVLIWLADIAAFFIGQKFGKHRLASKTSPAKSWEGVFGAIAFTSVMSFFYVKIGEQQVAAAGLMLLGIITVIFSIIGDLTESMFKRIAGVKNSGVIIPGHGGIFDRIDSLTAAAPIYVTGLWLLQGDL